MPTKLLPTTPYVFFGSATFSIYVLDELEKAGMPPSVIVTTPDKPAGRGMKLTPTDVKVWGEKRGIPVLDPAKLNTDFIANLREHISKNVHRDPNSHNNHVTSPITFFIVAAYGKIIPQAVIDIPSKGMLNIHPSLLPRYRGATPLQSAMLDDTKKTGVTIMRVDALLDHGPIVAQKEVTIEEWPTYEIFEETMARHGGRLLAHTLPTWLAGKIIEKEQDHTAATLTRKITKEDGLLEMPPKNQYETFRKIQAYHKWPTAYFFMEKINTKNGTTQKIRVKITKASWHTDHVVIERVIPEGKKETDFNSLF